MDWTRSDTLALASPQCSYCHGLGLKDGLENRGEPCDCVLRNIFRACHKHFRRCVQQDRHLSVSRLDVINGSASRYSWGRKDEEFIADFCLVTRRTLNESEYRLFKYHFLLGADWRACCRKLNMDRGTFFHVLYRLESKLGRVFRELQPYGLYPIADYFETARREAVCSSRRGFKVRPIRPPLRRSSHAEDLQRIA